MTATDELRLMLDERGVEWMPSAWSAKDETFYKVGDVGYLATELSSGKMKVCIEGYPTPEQTIAATLGDADETRERQGVGTCHDKCSRFNAWVCSECGATVLLMFDDYGEPSYSVDGVADVPHFCPNCGKRVEVSDG